MSEAESFDSFQPGALDGPGEGASELTWDDEVVSGLASGLYAELERLIQAHGEGAAADLVPLAVTALETLQGACAESRDRGAEAEREREENKRLLAQFERERAERKRTQERCLELEDLMEHDRKTQKAQMELAASENRRMEVKARNYADMMFRLEEEKSSLDREHNKLLQNYNVVLRSLKELQAQHRTEQTEDRRYSLSSTKRFGEQRTSTGGSSEAPSSLGREEEKEEEDEEGHVDSDQGPESRQQTSSISPSAPINSEQPLPLVDSAPPSPGEGVPDTLAVSEREGSGGCDQEHVLLPTSEHQESRQLDDVPVTSTPTHSEDERNTDSILQELQSVGSEFIEEIDGGVDLLDPVCEVEKSAAENIEHQEKHAALDSARRSLIARVEELLNDREQLRQRLQLAELSQAGLQSRVSELETTMRRSRVGATEQQKEEADDDSAQPQSFTRAEMSCVLTERNLYKERLMELQEAVHRMDKARALKQQQTSQERKSSIWERFHRLLARPSVPHLPLPPADAPVTSRRGSAWSLASEEGSGSNSSSEASSRLLRRDMYALIRRHIWWELGRSQIQGWSQPPTETLETLGVSPLSLPALLQVRLLDQKDPGTKLWCATGVQHSEGKLRQSGMSQAAEAKLQVSSGSLWICSGSHSETEVMVLDATRANHVLDHFTIANCRILCIASVPAHPGAQEEREPSWRQAAASRDPASHGHTSAEPTVWLGSQSGRLFLHLTDCCRRRCLHLVQLAECVHSIVYTGGFVVVTLGNGMLEIFHRNPDGTWDLTGHRSLDLGPPRHSVRCVVSVSDGVWCGYRNRVYIINLKHLKIQKWFEVTPHPERQVRHLAGQDEGVWVSVRLESVLRLFHTHSAQLLQEVNIQPFVTNMFGSRPPGLSLLQVTALSVICERLWIGTGTGFIVSAPLSAELAAGSIPKISNGAPAGQEDPLQGVAVPSTIPYCAMSLAQICFHGHRDAVRFFVSVSVSGPASQRVGVAADRASPPPSEEETTVLVVSGGEGYINFRIGEAGETYRGTPAMLKSERSHLVVSRVRT